MITQEYSQEELIRLFECYFDEIISSDGSVGDLYLWGYKYPLPNSIVNTYGDLVLRYYDYPLPDSIVNIYSHLYLRYYEHSLPNSIVNVDSLWVIDYEHQLPDSIINVSEIFLNNNQKLPKNLNLDKVEKIYYHI